MPRLPNGQFTSKNPVKMARQVSKNKKSIAKSLAKKAARKLS